MDGFDTSTMTYMAPHLPIVTDQDGFSKPGRVGMEMQDMFSNYDMSTYAGYVTMAADVEMNVS